MSTKLKSVFKKRILWPTGQPSIPEEEGKDGEELALRKKSVRRRHRSSLGVLEDIIKCPICKQILQSPRMLVCQHTFCKKCLEMKLAEKPNSEDNALRCPVCSAPTKSPALENLPTNLSVESVLRAVDGSFVEARPAGRSSSLVVNFAHLKSELRRKNALRCAKCETACERADFCRHCKQVFCQVCQAIHVSQLKDKLKLITDQLQITINKLEQRVVEFKEKTDSLKEVVTKEFDAKIAALNEEKEKKLELIQEIRTKGETSAEYIRQEILDSQLELIKQTDSDFDAIVHDDEKIGVYLDLHKKATDMLSSALSWQSKVADMIELKNEDVIRIRDKENKILNRPRLISERMELQRPSGLAVDGRKSEIYVACPASRQVIVFDRQYRIMRRIQHANMLAPQSVAILDDPREIFVTDKWTHTIFVFNRTGQLMRWIGEKGQAKGQLLCPEGIDALQSRNWIYVADTRNDRVQIFGVDGTFKGSIGPSDKGSDGKVTGRIVGVNNFNQPTDVAVSDNAVVIADCGHHKIKVFNHRGHLMFSIGGYGTFKGLLKSPEIVKLDKNNNIFVGDSENGRVQVFSPQGEFLRAFGSQGTAVGQFGWISGLVCLSNNDVLIADNKNNTITLF